MTNDNQNHIGSGMDAVTLHPEPESYQAWVRAAGSRDVGEWLTELAERASSERQYPVTLKLMYPVEHGGERIESLTLRRGRAADIKGIKIGGEVPTEVLIKIAARLSGQMPQVIEMLDMDDAEEVLAIAGDFYGRCLSGGRTRSR